MKAKVARKIGVPSSVQRLVLAGKQLEDDRAMLSYCLRGHSTLHSVLRLRGGVRTVAELAGAPGGLQTKLKASRKTN